jgi:alpha-glucosidase (family GH31 glycosyl hydrolase)
MDGVLTAKVWPNKTVFLDWFNPKSAEVWAQGLSDFYKEAPYDGLWLDMNEVTTFCDGECPNGGHSSNSSTDNSTQWYLSFPQDENSTYFLPFIPGQHNLDFMTISLNGTHPSTNYSQFDTHSLFGLMEAAATRNFLIGDDRSPHKGNRSFTLSRSTFAGSGVHTTHWLGDNHREWAYLNYSISGMMNFNMFGIPFVGPDTCGFFKSRYAADLQDEQQLCGRWMQLATFQPFGRLHRDKDDSDGGRGGNRTEPYLLEEPFQSWSRNALYNRLQFLRQLYTCHYSASRDGDTCFDPLLFHFPLDDGTFNETEHSFIYANALKVSPVL